jgi:hypothetical protein
MNQSKDTREGARRDACLDALPRKLRKHIEGFQADGTELTFKDTATEVIRAQCNRHVHDWLHKKR